MMRIERGAVLVVTLLGLFAGGCKTPSLLRWTTTNPSPVVFTQPPTADDIVRAVNSNTAPIRQLDTDNATVAAAGFPPLRANLALERPKKFRMRAMLLGPEVDIGSNDELFWMWVKHNEQPGLYYARHEQYAISPTRRILPVDPTWLAEALGVVQLDPLAPYQGPLTAGPGKLEIRTQVPSPEGELTRVYVIHEKFGWVLEQRVFDARGKLLASAIASQHQYYPDAGVSLPQRVELNVPAAEMALTFNVRSYRINALGASSDLLWSMPVMEGVPLVDIATPPGSPGSPPNAIPASAPAGVPSAAASYGPAAEMSAVPQYRGYTDRR